MAWYVWLGGALIGAGGLGGLISQIGGVWQSHRNEKSAAVTQGVDTLARLSQEQRGQLDLDMKLIAARDDRIEKLEADVAARDERIAARDARIAELEQQLKDSPKGKGA